MEILKIDFYKILIHLVFDTIKIVPFCNKNILSYPILAYSQLFSILSNGEIDPPSMPS